MPGGGLATNNGTYPGVFENAKVDGSFGVTSPLILRQYVLTRDNRSAVLVKTLNVTDRTGGSISTSFSSKSELALNLSTNGSALTFMGYKAPINTLDVSNSNTPNHPDPTNPVAASYQRAIVEIDADRSLHVTPVNTYSGNNGRAAILNDGQNIYYTAGNAGNGTGIPPVVIVNNTGVQIAQPNIPDTTVVGVQQGTSGAAKGCQYGYSVTQYGTPPYSADKSGKDDKLAQLAYCRAC